MTQPRPSGRIPLTGLAILVLAVWYTTSESGGRGIPRLSAAAAADPSCALDQGSVSAGSLPTGEFRYADSTVFDPGGYYAPEEPITQGGCLLKWLELHVVDYYYDGSLHYERPRLLVPPEVTVQFARTDSGQLSPRRCQSVVVTSDTISVQCRGTPLGDLSVDGHLLDRSGWYWNKGQYNTGQAVLLTARVVFRRGRTILYNRLHRFTFFTGD